VQIGVAMGAQWMQQSVLDAGLSVLSLASGAVLGAFLLGTLKPDVGARATFTGMLAGLATMSVVWSLTPIAWTWHALIGAVVTSVVALGVSPLLESRSSNTAIAP
jgi:Na+/proline symporter